jgi:putative ABC transport system permease protein
MRVPPGVHRMFRLPDSSERLLRELDDEVRFHVEMRARQLMAQGLDHERAMTEALRKFGDVDELRDYCHSIEVSQMHRVETRERMETIIQDLRFALRQYRKAPGFAFVAALTLALGVGATTAIFSVVSGVLLRPLPYRDSERIVQLVGLDEKGGPLDFPDLTFDDVERQNHTFAAVAKYQRGGAVSLVAGGEAVRAVMTSASRGYFDVLGIRPFAGRFFVPEEQQLNAAPAAIISYGFWQRQFGGSRSAIGSTMKSGDQTITIVGVMPPEQEFPAGVDLVLARETEGKTPSRTAYNSAVVGRIKNGVTVEQAHQDLSMILKRIKAEVGDFTWTVDGTVVPLREQVVGKIKPMLLLLLGASAVLLLIACANVVNLLVARLAVRESEIAVRLALGAGRARLVQQLLIESSLLALIGCVGGLVLAVGGVRVLLLLRPTSIPRVNELSVDWRVLAFALGVSAATALALGLFAAWRGVRGDLRAALSQSQRTQGGGGASYRIRGSLVVGQLAMTVVLLIGAGLLGRSFVHLMTIDPGYRTRQIVVAEVAPEGRSTPEGLAARVRYYDDAIEQLRALPGVTAVGGASAIPLTGGGSNGSFLILTNTTDKLQPSDFERLFQDKSRTGSADYRVASADYFRTLNIPLLSGRMFNDGDRAGTPEVAVISASLAKQRWANESPIGKFIEYGNMDGDLTPITIVGVVGDVRERSLNTEPRPVFYVNYRQRPASAGHFQIAIATTTPGSVVSSARRVLHDLRPDVPARITTIETLVTSSLAQQRFMLLLVGVFALVALILATLGVYSVISYLVAQRGRELSIRVALGATGRDVVQLVLGQGITLVVVGTVIGGAVALVATRLLKRMLYEISPTDPVAYAAVVVVLGLVALIASYVPARRAARAEPADVLRAS